VALAAAVGLAALPMRRRVRVAVFSTGDEVVEPGAPRGPDAIYDANRYLLSGLLTKLGVEVADLGIVADDPAALRTTLAPAAAGARRLLVSQAQGAARIRSRRAARGRRRRGRSGEIRAGRGGGDHLAHRDRGPRRAVRRRHDGRAGLDRRIPSLRGARGLSR